MGGGGGLFIKKLHFTRLTKKTKKGSRCIMVNVRNFLKNINYYLTKKSKKNKADLNGFKRQTKPNLKSVVLRGLECIKAL